MNSRWLVTGASGQLGGHVVRRLARRGDDVLALAGRGEVGTPGVAIARPDMRDADALQNSVRDYRPTNIIHTAATTSVADAYANPADAHRINVDATTALVDAAGRVGARFVFTSTDMVFDGTAAPYGEEDRPRPLSVYGQTKVDAEGTVLAGQRTLVVRPPLMYGFPVTPRATTFAQQVEALRTGRPLKLFADEFRTPAWVGDVAAGLIGLAERDAGGVLHMPGPQRLSRYEMVAAFAKLLGIERPNLEPVSRLSVAGAEARPADLSLDGSKLATLFPSLVCGAIRREALVEVATE